MTQPPPPGQPGAPTQQVYYIERKKPTYPVMWTLLAINIVFYLAMAVVPGFFEAVVLSYSLAKVEPWRLITSAFVHFGILHLVLNMVALYFLGRPLEQVFGRVKFLVLYLASALGGSALFLVFAQPLANPYQETIAGGASGAIFGLFGSLLVLQLYKVIQAGSLLPILGLNLVMSFLVPGIGWQAHIGGLIIGIGVTWAYMRGVKRETSSTMMWVEVGAIVALVVATIIARYTVLA
ncbi:rhomboid family intramembrane serine protease [Propionibacteriaceae bacterium Y1923]|uniref:rhomboid family intramembrane serine protease n=1 Tax=Aestuariimicrobium sp. Y1814 TaxID=3418742 RepID=UPI003C17E4B1